MQKYTDGGDLGSRINYFSHVGLLCYGIPPGCPGQGEVARFRMGGVHKSRHESVENLSEMYVATSKLHISAVVLWSGVEKIHPLNQSANPFAKTEPGQDSQSLNFITSSMVCESLRQNGNSPQLFTRPALPSINNVYGESLIMLTLGNVVLLSQLRPVWDRDQNLRVSVLQDG